MQCAWGGAHSGPFVAIGILSMQHALYSNYICSGNPYGMGGPHSGPYVAICVFSMQQAVYSNYICIIFGDSYRMRWTYTGGAHSGPFFIIYSILVLRVVLCPAGPTMRKMAPRLPPPARWLQDSLGNLAVLQSCGPARWLQSCNPAGDGHGTTRKVAQRLPGQSNFSKYSSKLFEIDPRTPQSCK